MSSLSPLLKSLFFILLLLFIMQNLIRVKTESLIEVNRASWLNEMTIFYDLDSWLYFPLMIFSYFRMWEIPLPQLSNKCVSFWLIFVHVVNSVIFLHFLEELRIFSIDWLDLLMLLAVIRQCFLEFNFLWHLILQILFCLEGRRCVFLHNQHSSIWVISEMLLAHLFRFQFIFFRLFEFLCFDSFSLFLFFLRLFLHHTLQIPQFLFSL